MSDPEPQTLTRNSAFSYTCNRCMSCCHDAHIALDPYEIARLARNLRISTTEFIAKYLIEGGIVLRNKHGGACGLLGDGACSVYQDRPLVCRTYPLRRRSGVGGEEFIKPRELLPTGKGILGESGTVEGFLKGHDIAPFVAASDRYFGLVQHIIEALGSMIRSTPGLFAPIRDMMQLHFKFRTNSVPEMVDVDRVAAEYCRARGKDQPEDLDELISTHIRAIEEKLTAVFSAVSKEDSPPSGISGTAVKASRREVMDFAALAGAIGAATGARVSLLLMAAVLGKSPELKTTPAQLE